MLADQQVTRRRLLTALTGATCSIAFAACRGSTIAPTAAPAATNVPAASAIKGGSTPTAQPVAESVPAKSGQIKVSLAVHWSGKDFDRFQTLIDEYNKGQGLTDNVHVDLVHFLAKTFTDQMSEFISDYQAGTAKDMYHLFDALFPDLANKGLYDPAPPEVQQYVKANYYPGPVAASTWKGQIYGYPTENQPSVLFLTGSNFKKVGLDVTKDAPKNWGDLRAVSKKLVVMSGGKPTQVGYTWNAGVDWRQFKDRVMMHHLQGEEFIDTQSMKVNLDSDVGRQVTQLYYDMAVTDKSTSVGLGKPDDLFTKGVSSMMYEDSWYVRFDIIDLGGKDFLAQQHAVLMPNASGDKTGSITHNYTLLVSSQSKQKDVDWKFLKWLNQKPDTRMQKFETDVFGFAPSHKDYHMPDFFPPDLRDVFVKANEVAISLPEILGIPALQEALMKHQDDLVFGKITPTQFTTQATADLNQVLKTAYQG